MCQLASEQRDEREKQEEQPVMTPLGMAKCTCGFVTSQADWA